MTEASFSRLAAGIFVLIAALQLTRIALGWDLTINGAHMPFWPSWIAAAVALVLAVLGFRATVSR